jgi:hypothetical protein
MYQGDRSALRNREAALDVDRAGLDDATRKGVAAARKLLALAVVAAARRQPRRSDT